VTATYVETRDVPLTALTKYPGNAKRGRVEEIRASIRRHDQYRSLVVRFEQNALTILAGNHTFDALKAEGRTTARCEIIQCDDDTARRINLADNRTSEIGGYDYDALAELLTFLDGDYEGTGYTDAEAALIIDPPDIGEDPQPAPSGIGDPVIAYQLVFDTDIQQAAWFSFLRYLKRRHPDLETAAERLHAFIGGLDMDGAGQ
jgi:hypothetical protein